MSADKRYEILGVGNPLLDHVLLVEQAYLDRIPGEKYGMETIGYEEMVAIIENSGSTPKLVAGGSCANAMKGLASLGRKCAITGKVGTDASGEKVVEDLQRLGVIPLLRYSSTPTAHVVCLITPNGKRTCRAFLGAAEELRPEDLEPDDFRGAALIHIEGYSLLYPGLTRRAMELAKQKGAAVSLDLGSFEVVRAFKPLVHDLIKDSVDIAFANTDEIFALTGKSPKEGCLALSKIAPVAVVMMGSEGCWIGAESRLTKCPAFPVEPLDTTGAGDLFASGFLHAYLSGKTLEESARWGAIVAREVVQQIGAEIPAEKWPSITRQLR